MRSCIKSHSKHTQTRHDLETPDFSSKDFPDLFPWSVFRIVSKNNIVSKKQPFETPFSRRGGNIGQSGGFFGAKLSLVCFETIFVSKQFLFRNNRFLFRNNLGLFSKQSCFVSKQCPSGFVSKQSVFVSKQSFFGGFFEKPPKNPRKTPETHFLQKKLFGGVFEKRRRKSVEKRTPEKGVFSKKQKPRTTGEPRFFRNKPRKKRGRT